MNYKLQNHVADWLKVVPRKRDVGLNPRNLFESVDSFCRSSQEGRGFECLWFSYFFWKYNVVPRKRDVGLNVNDIENLK